MTITTGHQAISPDSTHAPAKSPAANDPHAAAQAFEAMFVAQLLRAMPASDGGLAGRESGPYGDFLIDQYAKLITERGGLGVSAAIDRQLSSIAKGKSR